MLKPIEIKTGQTTEEIAASILAPLPTKEKVGDEAMALASDVTDPEVDADDTDANPTEETAPSGENDPITQKGETEEEVELSDETSEEEVADEDKLDEVDELTAAEPDYLDITDDDMIEVSIDGKIEYRSVKEAKTALAGEGAIQARLQQATETRNSINVERDEMRLKLEEQRTSLVNTISQLSEQLFKPTIAPPDEALRISNPSEYIQKSEAYLAEQTAIVEKQSQLKQYVADQATQQQQNMSAYRDQQQALLHSKIPALADPQQTPIVAKQILDAARHYGFKDQEIGVAYDHRLFLMALDAGKYRALKAEQKVTDPQEVVASVRREQRKAPRKLRSGVAARKTAARQKAKDNAKARDKARHSGKTSDIANFIMS